MSGIAQIKHFTFNFNSKCKLAQGPKYKNSTHSRLLPVISVRTGRLLPVISVRTGAIYTTRQLVFNANQPAVHLVVTATDYGTPVRQSTAITVQITVEDVNNNAPVFTLPSYR